MERSRGGRSARLLLVEDSPADARYLREVFKEAKIWNHLHVVNDAEAALVHLASETPDLILLDMRLPGMQGSELIRALRADARHASVPIVVLAPSELHAERLASLHAPGGERGVRGRGQGHDSESAQGGRN